MSDRGVILNLTHVRSSRIEDLMETKVNLQLTIASLAEAVRPLSLSQKQQLVEMLEQQIFEEEEENYEDDAETRAEIEAIEAEYDAGDCITFDRYVENQYART